MPGAVIDNFEWDYYFKEQAKQIFDDIKQHKNFSSLGALKEYIEYLEKKWLE